MNNQQLLPKWKKALKWVVLLLASLVVFDWLLDGRLRERLPLRRRRN